MQKKYEAHKSLSLLFSRDGVPPRIIMDGAREETMGKFRKKACEANCHVKETEPYNLWSNSAERTFREVKLCRTYHL